MQGGNNMIAYKMSFIYYFLNCFSLVYGWRVRYNIRVGYEKNDNKINFEDMSKFGAETWRKIVGFEGTA